MLGELWWDCSKTFHRVGVVFIRIRSMEFSFTVNELLLGSMASLRGREGGREGRTVWKALVYFDTETIASIIEDIYSNTDCY